MHHSEKGREALLLGGACQAPFASPHKASYGTTPTRYLQNTGTHASVKRSRRADLGCAERPLKRR